MKKNLTWLFWILVLIFVYVLVSRFTQVKELINTLEQGKWIWVLVAALLQYLFFILYSGIYHTAFSVVGVKSSLKELIPVMFGSVFMNVATPLAGSGGSVLFIDDARRRNESVPRATTAVVLVYLSFLVSFQLLMIPGFIYLAARSQLYAYQIITGSIMYHYIIVIVVLLNLAVRKPNLLLGILGWVRSLVNWIGRIIRKPQLIKKDWILKISTEFIDAALAFASRPRQVAMTFIVAFLTHLVNMLSLFAIYMAFYKTVSVGVLVATYAITFLFLVVSVTPQGIGIVEGVMVLVITSLGIPKDVTTVVTLAFRGISFWLPLIIGFILLRQLRIFNPKAKPFSDSLPVYLVALLTLTMGLLNVFSTFHVVLPENLLWFTRFLPLEIQSGGRLTALAAGFALILLAYGLLRRKRVAWMAAIIVLCLSAISHLIIKLDFSMAVMAVLLASWLIILNPHFHARSDSPSIRQGIITLLLSILFTGLFGLVGSYLLFFQSSPTFNLGTLLRQTWELLAGFDSPSAMNLDGLGVLLAGSIYIIASIAFGWAIFLLLRPVVARYSVSPAERNQAKKIIQAYGTSSLVPFTLLMDKLYYFSESGSVITYRVQGRVAIALGDPIGPIQDSPVSIREFIIFCRKNDWIPAFYQIPEGTRKFYDDVGLKQIRIGQEGIIDLKAFSIEDPKYRQVCKTLQKMERKGYSAEYLTPPHPREVMRELWHINDAWLTMTRGTEMRFSLGWFYDNYIKTNPVLTIKDQNGYAVAFANVLARPQTKSVILDLLRYRPEDDPRILDYLLISMVLWAKKNKQKTFNVGLSATVGDGQKQDGTLAERGLYYIYEHIDTSYEFKGLHKIKEKFNPRWEPRYMAFPDYGSLPAVAMALIRVDSDENWLGRILKY
ncbi:MAG: flippase-like domain-containing protein [Anaerolineaceae bacterium]